MTRVVAPPFQTLKLFYFVLHAVSHGIRETESLCLQSTKRLLESMLAESIVTSQLLGGRIGGGEWLAWLAGGRARKKA